MSQLEWQQVAAWRMTRQHLAVRAAPRRLVDVVRDLCGVHAQLASSAELTLWARIDGLEPGVVAAALWEQRRLVKTWAMRGTLHLLPSDELGLWIAAMSLDRRWERPSWQRGFGISVAELDAIQDAIDAALHGRELTREELAVEVGRRTGSAKLGDRLRESWGALLKPAAFRGHLLFGPPDGQKVRFASPASWLGAAPESAGERALGDVVRRFLRAYGPATRDDLRRWWGISPAQAGRLVAGLSDEVAEVTVAGAPAWLLADDVDTVAAAAPARLVRLVPAFDQYVVAATRHADALLPGPFADRIYRQQGWLSPVLLVDGRLEGTWKHERKGRALSVAVEPFRKQPAWARRGVEAEAERLAAYLGGELRLTVGSSAAHKRRA